MTNKEDIVWKTYPEIDFLQANQFGEVRTVDHYVTCKDGRKRFVKGYILKQQLRRHGYMQVHISVNGKEVHLYTHRIVASCFLPNPDNLPEVNHKDCNPSNNKASNLEWCTPQYNVAYREKYGISAAEVCGRSVFAVNSKTEEVFRFETQHEAAQQLEVNRGSLNSVLKGRRNQTGGCWFCYADSNAVETTRLKFGDEVADKVKALLDEKIEK